MTAATDGVPIDSFPIRLAIARAVMGWNYDQAARATGIGSETWRTWEKGRRRCSDITTVAKQIAAVTGLSVEWLVLGGPLATIGPEGTVTPLHATTDRDGTKESGGQFNIRWSPRILEWRPPVFLPGVA